MSSLNLGTVAASLAALAVILGFARVLFRLFRRTGHFLDDWNGEAPRPGQPPRPGVLEQLASVQAEQTRVSKELQHNGGGSLKDAVKRIEIAQKEDRVKLDTLTALLGGFVGNEQQARLEGRKAESQMWSAVEAITHNDNDPTQEA